MGKQSKSRKTALAMNAARHHQTFGKNPHVLDMKIEFGIHKLVYLDLRPNRNLTF